MTRPCRQRAVLAVLAVLAMLAGCPKAPAPIVGPPDKPVTTVLDDASDDERRERLRRDLASTALDNYAQLNLGNLEAYRDSVMAGRHVALLGVDAGAALVGRPRTGADVDRRLWVARGARIVSKNLDVALSRDQSVGWLYDEISYRVPFLGREASIPVRVTTVMVRDIDRWQIVLEHLSYPVSLEEIVHQAARGELAAPRSFPTAIDRRARAADLERFFGFHTAEARARAEMLAADALVLLPDAAHEATGEAASALPPLSQIFGSLGQRARVEVGAHRLWTSPSGTVAWGIANLKVATSLTDEPVIIGMRASYVLQKTPDGWKLEQVHVSVPQRERDISMQVFGEVIE